jgi:hypothetical protein
MDRAMFLRLREVDRGNGWRPLGSRRATAALPVRSALRPILLAYGFPRSGGEQAGELILCLVRQGIPDWTDPLSR